MNAFGRWICRTLIVCMPAAGFPLPAQAGIVSTERISSALARDHIKNFLDRTEVRAQFEALGVDANAARARVDALTDAEAAELAARVDQLPAGGDGGLGAVLVVLLVVFLVLLITDILGLTKVFPFTRTMR